jgi:hypothetical protein
MGAMLAHSHGGVVHLGNLKPANTVWWAVALVRCKNLMDCRASRVKVGQSRSEIARSTA